MVVLYLDEAVVAEEGGRRRFSDEILTYGGMHQHRGRGRQQTSRGGDGGGTSESPPAQLWVFIAGSRTLTTGPARPLTGSWDLRSDAAEKAVVGRCC